MKKPLIVAVVLFLCFTAFALDMDDMYCSDSHSRRERAMGYTGASVNGTTNNLFCNPASLYYYNSRRIFYLDFAVRDDIFSPKYGFRLTNDPSVALSGQIVGKNASLAVTTGFSSFRETEQEDTADYRFEKDADIDAVFALGKGNFGAGIGVKAGSGRTSEASVKNSIRLYEIISKGLFSESVRDSSMAYVNVRAGVGYKVGRFDFGLLFDNLIDTRTMGSLSEYKIDYLKDAVCFGLSYSTPEFSKHGRLNSFACSLNAEAWSFLNSEKATFRFGAEVKVLFEKSWTIALRAGTVVPARDASDGISTYGIASQVNNFNIYINAEIPFGWYVNSPEEGIPFTLGCTYSF